MKGKNILAIVIIIVLLVTLIVLFFAFAGKEQVKEQKASVTEQLKACLQDWNTDCNILFQSENMPELCAELKDNKDDCFFKLASLRFEPSFCEKIIDKTKKDNCLLVTQPTFGEA